MTTRLTLSGMYSVLTTDNESLGVSKKIPDEKRQKLQSQLQEWMKDETDRLVKDASPEHIKEFLISRLKTIFPCVSNNPRIFKNSKNSPMFLFCFAISNESVAAQRLALRIADHILKNK